VAVTLPTDSLPETSSDPDGDRGLSDPTSTDPDPHDPAAVELGLSSPAAFIAVVAVSALVLIGCVLAATVGGLFGSFSPAADRATPAPTWIDPSRREAATSFDDGQWLVARDIHAGTYRTSVPATSPGCAWERNASTDGTASSVLESGAGPAGTALAVTIKETDAVFLSHGCGSWQLVVELLATGTP
jgi:hypothetical protein